MSPARPHKNLTAGTAAFYYQLKINLNNRETALLWAFSPVIFGTAVALLYRAYDASSLTLYAFFGAIIFSIWTSSLYLSGLSMGNERMQGTMELQLASPVGLQTIMIGKGFANTCHGLISALIATVVVVPLAVSSLDFSHPAELFLSAILSLIAISALGILLAPLFLLLRAPLGLLAILEPGVILLSGTLYPLDMLPSVVHPFAWLLSPRWASDALVRSGGGSYDMTRLMLDWLLLLALTLGYLVLARWLFHLTERQVRVSGSLGSA